jgi:hypothetical protein
LDVKHPKQQKKIAPQVGNVSNPKANFSLHAYEYYRRLQSGAHPCGSLRWFFDKIALLYWHNLI